MHIKDVKAAVTMIRSELEASLRACTTCLKALDDLEYLDKEFTGIGAKSRAKAPEDIREKK